MHCIVVKTAVIIEQIYDRDEQCGRHDRHNHGFYDRCSEVSYGEKVFEEFVGRPFIAVVRYRSAGYAIYSPLFFDKTAEHKQHEKISGERKDSSIIVGKIVFNFRGKYLVALIFKACFPYQQVEGLVSVILFPESNFG